MTFSLSGPDSNSSLCLVTSRASLLHSYSTLFAGGWFVVCQTLQSSGLGLQEEGSWPQGGGAMGIVVVAVAGRGWDGQQSDLLQSCFSEISEHSTFCA